LGDGALAATFNAACDDIDTEECKYWADLRASGLLTGVGFKNPINAYSGVIAIVNEATGTLGIASGLNICMGSLPAKAAESIDAALDDGNPDTGAVRASLGAGNAVPSATAVTTYEDDGSNKYTVCKTL
jgi:hypothetical protein